MQAVAQRGSIERSSGSGVLTVHRLRRMDYLAAVELQRRCFVDIDGQSQRVGHLILVEHPPTITLGRSARGGHVLADAGQLAAEGIEVHSSNRGGDVTFHGPGQLVMYPIVRLDVMGLGLRSYLRSLEQWMIDVARLWGIEAGRCELGTGVWVNERKIAAMGITARRWIAYHGVSVNVCVDLDYFDLIVPCGIAGCRVTSMQAELGSEVAIDDVAETVVEEFVRGFRMDGWTCEYC